MIPPRETERLLVSAVTAGALAKSGQKRLGYEWLQAGYLQAQDCELQGQEWASKLVERWKQVMDAFCAEFDFTPGPAGEQDETLRSSRKLLAPFN